MESSPHSASRITSPSLRQIFFLSRDTKKDPPDLFVVCLATEKPLSNVPFVPLLRGFLHIYSLIPLFVLSEEFVIDAITKDK